MNTIPLVFSDVGLGANVAEIVMETYGETYDVLPIKDLRQAIDFLNIELPELLFIDFSDSELDGRALLDEIMNDRWLLQGGVIALCENPVAASEIEKIRGANIVVALAQDTLRDGLPRVLRIIQKNRRILFQRQIGLDLVQNISGSFSLQNDPLEASCYVNLVCNFLYNAGRLDIDSKADLGLALHEMLMNAIEHGNCGITYEDKEEWLQGDRYIMDLIEQRCQDPAIAKRRVTFEYAIGPASSSFLIADEGEGFNWRAMADPSNDENLLRRHGRGILMTKISTRNLSYNEKGNEVRFEIAHPDDVPAPAPGLFKNIEPRIVKKGDILFRQGEPGNCIFYIVKGRYDVVVNDRTVSSMTPEDVFMGEIAFLLNSRRSATVRASTDGELIEMSKEHFVQAIKKTPHYAILLARLLAERIQRADRRTTDINL